MKSGELAKRLNLPTSTLHKYSQDYKTYLSAPGAGHREYTEQDERILRLILEMKAERTPQGDIDVTLSSLQAGNWERLPALDEPAKSLVPTQDNVIALDKEKTAMQREIDLLREMLTESRADRDTLLARLYRAETLLELYQSGKLKPE